MISARTVAFKVPWFQITAKTVDGQDGSVTMPYWVVEPPDYVSVLALTPGKRALLIRQYRPAQERMMLELPSGYVDRGETPEQAVMRELAEETGYTARNLELLGSLAPDAGRIGNRLWAYLARDVVGPESNHQPEPNLELVVIPAGELFDLSIKGEFDHALNLAVLFLAQAKYGRHLFGL